MFAELSKANEIWQHVSLKVCLLFECALMNDRNGFLYIALTCILLCERKQLATTAKGNQPSFD